ncbi:hypothetical protein Kpol_1064p57 [Vanderwaltozyma polyspora DSM 70294]|uniref:DASH complex subunit SPC19 n=1 Tax=Vanderwaltozyma polyspora (strain ATCC 22028 / DSM 70294 / BCRC 21397 / CBS 2163 / NBRC 10782 / NRRL Y-8283 / UCD 57-17) TaxID=436907 RepID=A7TMI1_VANPO|nr:uncharacterized protein Kpol_1064p57 [Vanderwaltozyma polyspora DSM 70294]EDO16575.1 hypothetical protein Kpol_1064p57 [Vanderwaltozyma polyspora DSM 70294]
MSEYLEQSVDSLSSAIVMMQRSIEKLKREGEANNSLTGSVLQSKRVFELISGYDVDRAKLAKSEEVDPLVRTLNDKLDKSLGKLQRELDTLQQTYELNKLRLNNNSAGSMDVDVSTDMVIMASSTNEELEELKELKLTREALQRQLQELQDEGL